MNQIENILNNTEASSLINIFEHSVEPILITNTTWDDGLKIIYTNRAFCNTTGYSKDELLGVNPKIFQGKDSNQKVLKDLKKELLKGNHFIGQSINYKKDNTSYIVKWSISPLKDKDGNTIAYISFQKTIERTIQIEHEKLLNSIVNTSKNLILVTDLEGNIVYLNDAFNKKLGYSKDELIGTHSRILKSGMQNEKFYQKMWNSILKTGTFSDIFISRTKDGTLFYDKKHITTIKDIEGNPIFYVSTSTDITKQIKKQKNLESQVYIDSLTETFNKKKFEEVMQEQIKTYHNSNKVFSLILIDIDFFKKINDEYGHDIGDYILVQFAKLIRENIRDTDLLFRWGGEEFAIIVQSTKEHAFKIAEKLRIQIANKSFDSVTITSSFGISEISQNMDKNTLFSNADKALYKAKHNGRDQVQIF
jgi:diguanylate cyclase (GGDEF)-like protein/PAS domain S-box-containing protein